MSGACAGSSCHNTCSGWTGVPVLIALTVCLGNSANFSRTPIFCQLTCVLVVGFVWETSLISSRRCGVRRHEEFSASNSTHRFASFADVCCACRGVFSQARCVAVPNEVGRQFSVGGDLRGECNLSPADLHVFAVSSDLSWAR